MNPNLPVYKRTPAFIDFSAQMDRPNMSSMPLNEARFCTIDHFPPNSLSSVKHEPAVDIQRQLQRNPGLLNRGINMSDSCYDHKDRDRIRAKAARGIL